MKSSFYFPTSPKAHGRSVFAFYAIQRWFGFRMDALMFLFIALVTILAVVVNEQELVAISPATLGLALTMLIQLSGLFQYMVRQVSTYEYRCKLIHY